MKDLINVLNKLNSEAEAEQARYYEEMKNKSDTLTICKYARASEKIELINYLKGYLNA